MPRLRSFAAYVTALACALSIAHAAPGARVLVTIDATCDGVDIATVRRAMAIDLAAPVEIEAGHDPAAPKSVDTHVTIECKDGRLLVAVDDPLTDKHVARSLAWDSAAIETRSRVLAFAASELVIASWAELAVSPPPSAPPTAVLPSTVATPTVDQQEARRVIAPRLTRAAEPKPVTPRSQLRLTALGGAQTFFGSARTLWGGGLAVARDERHYVGWIVDTLARHGGIDVPVGHVSIDLVAFGLACWLHRTWKRVTLRGGIGARGGAVRFAGSSPATALVGRTYWGPWLGVNGAGTVEVALSSRLAVQVGVEIGYVGLSSAARAYGHDLVAIKGGWITANVGLTIFP